MLGINTARNIFTAVFSSESPLDDEDTITLNADTLSTDEFEVDFEGLLPLTLEWQPEINELVVTPEFGLARFTSGVVLRIGEYPMCGLHEGCPAAYIGALGDGAAAWFLLDEIAPISLCLMDMAVQS